MRTRMHALLAVSALEVLVGCSSAAVSRVDVARPAASIPVSYEWPSWPLPVDDSKRQQYLDHVLERHFPEHKGKSKLVYDPWFKEFNRLYGTKVLPRMGEGGDTIAVPAVGKDGSVFVYVCTFAFNQEVVPFEDNLLSVIDTFFYLGQLLIAPDVRVRISDPAGRAAYNNAFDAMSEKEQGAFFSSAEYVAYKRTQMRAAAYLHQLESFQQGRFKVERDFGNEVFKSYVGCREQLKACAASSDVRISASAKEVGARFDERLEKLYDNQKRHELREF